MTKLILSHRLEILTEHLAKGLVEDGLSVFTPRIIMVPNSSMKQWILIQVANGMEAKGIAGCKVITLQEAIQTYLSPPRFTEIFCTLFKTLGSSQNQEIGSFLGSSPNRIVELASTITTLFIRYGTFCPALFEADPSPDNWQKELIQSLFVKGKLRLPVQMDPVSTPPIHCFGFDYLPPIIWKSFQFDSVYLFSPCRHYWEDLCTTQERKRLDRYWKKKGASDETRKELDAYLKDAPPLLANWGKIGRETLKILDAFDWEIEEDYRPKKREKSTNLSRLKERLLDFTVTETEGFSEDASIRVTKTGSSPLKEIEHLRTSILQLVNKEGLQFSDIAVLAPDIQTYASLIRFVFSDLPFRIAGLEIGQTSFFYQGLNRFLELDFHSDDLMALFENPSFYRARGWDLEVLEEMREWLSSNRTGLEERLLDQFVYLFPKEKKRISNGSADTLEQFIEIYQSLLNDLALLKSLRPLSDWAKVLMSLAEKYFVVDPLDVADAAAWSFFKQTLNELAYAGGDGHLFPFEPIAALLKRSVPEGQIHSAYLHAIRFASLGEGSLLPVRALYLIGMDEDHFPRRSSLTSLDLLTKEKIYTFDPVNQDRYLCLQALFAANDFLHISYPHLSTDGSPVNPSPIIEEFIGSLDSPGKVETAPSQTLVISTEGSFPWPEKPSHSLPEGEHLISIADLSALARHPWQFYLQKKLGIRFEKPEEVSFLQQKTRLLKLSFQEPMESLVSELPIGICGEALKMDMEMTSKDWAESIRAWDLQIEPLSFKLSCRRKKRVAKGWEVPALEFNLNSNLRVKLVGDVLYFSEKGFIHTGADTLEGFLKAWPECLASLAVSGKQEIYFLKSGRVKTVHQPEEALKAFIFYYFLAMTAPSPLLCSWADPFLRKGPLEWEKKVRDTLLGKGIPFDDPILDWVAERVCLPLTSTWFGHWDEPLSRTFSSLCALYAGGKHATV